MGADLPHAIVQVDPTPEAPTSSYGVLFETESEREYRSLQQKFADDPATKEVADELERIIAEENLDWSGPPAKTILSIVNLF